MPPIDALKKHLFSILVRDVPDHDCRATVLTVQDAVQVYHKLRIFLALPALGGLLRWSLLLWSVCNCSIKWVLGSWAGLVLDLRECDFLILTNPVTERMLNHLRNCLTVGPKLLCRSLLLLLAELLKLNIHSLLRTSKVCRHGLVFLVTYRIYLIWERVCRFDSEFALQENARWVVTTFQWDRGFCDSVWKHARLYIQDAVTWKHRMRAWLSLIATKNGRPHHFVGVFKAWGIQWHVFGVFSRNDDLRVVGLRLGLLLLCSRIIFLQKLRITPLHLQLLFLWRDLEQL